MKMIRPHCHVPVHRSAGSRPERSTIWSLTSASWSSRPTKAGIPPPWRWNFHAVGGSQFHHPAGAVLPVLCLRHRADGQDGARYPLHLHRFPDVGHGGLGINRPSDFEKLSSDKRLAWRALSTLGAQLPLMDPSLSVEEVPANNWHAHRHGHGLHSKRPHACQWAHGCARCFLIMQVSCAPIVRGWLHLHGIHFKSHMDGGRPFVSAPPLSVLHGMLMPNATHTRNQLCSKKHGPG